MPKKGEKSRKIKLLKSNRKVRPPKKWWIMMYRGVKKQYPTYNLKQRNRIIGGIWNS